MKNWKEFTLVDSDGAELTYESSDDKYIELMNEYRETGTIFGYFFDATGTEYEEEPWLYTPKVDWEDA